MLCLIVFSNVLFVVGVQGQNNWGVNYPATQMCAVNGSTVDMHCTYSYPLNDNGIDTTVTDRFWLIEGTVDLKTQPKYAGRAEYICDNRKCTLRIRDLTESDSAVYKFRFITNQAGGSYTGQPGVTLTVTGNIYKFNVKSVFVFMSIRAC